MRKYILVLMLAVVLTLGLAGSAAAAPNLASTEAGLGIYAESIFGVIYYGGVTFNLFDGCGVGIGTLLGEGAFQTYLVNGTLNLGPVLLDLQALTDTNFEQYFGMLGGYIELDLGTIAIYPGVGLFFAAFDWDNNGTIDADEISSSDPFVAAELQFDAGDITIYVDAMMGFGDTQMFLGKVGLMYSF